MTKSEEIKRGLIKEFREKNIDISENELLDMTVGQILEILEVRIYNVDLN